MEKSVYKLTEKYPGYFPWYLVVVVLTNLAVLKKRLKCLYLALEAID